MSKNKLPCAFYAEADASGVRITFDCGDTNHYLTGAEVRALIDELTAKYGEWRGRTSQRGKMRAVLDRCVTGRPS